MADDASRDDMKITKKPELIDDTSSHNKLLEVQETEVTPLLSPPPGESAFDPPASKHALSPRVILFLMGALALLAQCGEQLIEAPQTRIFESIYCYEYWETADPSKIRFPRSSVGPGALGGVDEQWCKIAEVQAKIAYLKGTQAFLDGFPCLILAIPVGILADRWGRKPLLLATLSSFVLRRLWVQLICWFWQAFDIRLTWISALHGVLGGGSVAATALLFVVVSDVSGEENRSIVFTRLYTAVMLANCLTPLLSAWIMTFNPWIALFMGVTTFLSAVLIMTFIPETLGYNHPTLKAKGKSVDQIPTPNVSERTLLRGCIQPLWDAMGYFLQGGKLVGLLLACAVNFLIVAADPLLLQYCSTRYNLTFSRATTVLSVKYGFSIVVFLVVQPWVSRMLLQTGMSSMKMDLVLARASAVLTCLGWVLIGLAPNTGFFVTALLVVTMGAGFPLFIRSFLTGLVEANKVAELYSIISIIDTIGLMGGSPVFAWLFKIGLGLGGPGLGLPFWFLGIVCGGAAVLLFSIKHEEGEATVEEVQDDD